MGYERYRHNICAGWITIKISFQTSFEKLLLLTSTFNYLFVSSDFIIFSVVISRVVTEAISMECWCPLIVVIFFRDPGSIPTEGKRFAEIILLFTMKQYKMSTLPTLYKYGNRENLKSFTLVLFDFTSAHSHPPAKKIRFEMINFTLPITKNYSPSFKYDEDNLSPRNGVPCFSRIVRFVFMQIKQCIL